MTFGTRLRIVLGIYQTNDIAGRNTIRLELVVESSLLSKQSRFRPLSGKL